MGSILSKPNARLRFTFFKAHSMKNILHNALFLLAITLATADIARGAAVVTTLSATGVGTTNATLNGIVNPNGSTMNCGFQFSTNGGWVASTAASGITGAGAMTEDSAGNLYVVAPDYHGPLTKVTADGVVTNLISGSSFTDARAVTLGGDGNVYVADLWCIRKYNVATGVMTVFAGDPNVTQQSVDGTGTAARFRTCNGITTDRSGNFYVGSAYRIRKVTADAVVTSLTDQGSNVGYRDGPAKSSNASVVALIDVATGIAVDDSGNLYWAEPFNQCIRKLTLDATGTNGWVSTLAGTNSAGWVDGSGSAARFNYPSGVTIDTNGNIFVADLGNNCIRKVTPAGEVTTLRDNFGSTGDFSAPHGMAMDRTGKMLVGDRDHNRVRRMWYGLIDPVTSVAARSGLTGTGNVATSNTVFGLNPGTRYSFWAVATNSASASHGETLYFTTTNGTTTLAVSSDRSPSVYGENVTLIATVTPSAPLAASGTVVFKDSGVVLGNGTLNNGAAPFTTNRLIVGSHSITAEYAGDGHYGGSTNSLAFTQTVGQATPSVTNWPAACAITYGQTLAASALVGGSAVQSGTFAWIYPGLVPDVGTGPQDVVFTPTDNVNYTTTNGTVSVKVSKASSSVTVWPTAAAINFGDLLSASALNGGSGTPAGTFGWKSPTNRPSGGTSVQRVIYTPDDTARYVASTGTVSVTVNAVPTANVLASSLNPSLESESVTFTATLSPTSPNTFIPSGTVTFKDGAATLGTGTLNGGVATFATAGLSAGIHSITAEYAGNESFLGATNAPPLTQTVTPSTVVLQNPDTSAAALSGTVLNTQQMVAVMFTVGSNNLTLACAALRMRYEGASPSSDSIRCSLYDVNVDVLGSCLPNTVLAFSDSGTLALSKSDTSWYTISFSDAFRNTLLYAGRTYALGLSIPTAGTSVDRSIKNITAQNTPYTMAPGYTFVQNVRSTTATPNWSASSDRFGIVLTGKEIPRTPTTTLVSADVNPSACGSRVTFTAAVSPVAASGAVTFKDGIETLCTRTLNGGIATFATGGLSGGSHSITAEYAGDTQYGTSVNSPALVQTVIPPPAVTTLPATDVGIVGVTLSGSVNPNGLSADSFFQFATNTGWRASTLAGSSMGYADGDGRAAQFYLVADVATDGAGNLYVADNGDSCIRKVTPAGLVTTLAGTNTPGMAAYYTDGTGSAAHFRSPLGVAVNGEGTVFVADTGNNRIRKVTPAGVVATLAGSGTAGFADGTGSAAQFSGPSGIAADGAGTVFVADTGNNRIRKVTPVGVVTTLAGSGTAGFADGPGSAAQFSGPIGLAADGAGNVFVADTGNNRIRKVTPAGVVTTLAGTNTAGFADGTCSAAQFSGPYGVAADGAGNMFVADTGNNRIRKVTSAGVVTTLAGTNTAGFVDDVGGAAKFFSPRGVAADSAGALFVADRSNFRIRKLVYGLAVPATTVVASRGLTGTSATAISTAASGLQPATTYYFQALASFSSGTNTGAVLSFTTCGDHIQSLALTDGAITFQCVGIPGARYDVERTTRLTAPVEWTPLSLDNPLQAGSDGLFEFTDAELPQASSVFYRLAPYAAQP